MPQLEGGDIKSVEKKALHTSKLLKEFIDDGYKVLAIVPSCTLMLKYEWPLINNEDENISYCQKILMIFVNIFTKKYSLLMIIYLTLSKILME